MRKTLWINLALLLVIPGLLFTVSCAKKTVRTDTGMASSSSGEAVDQAKLDEEARLRAIKEAELAAEKRRKMMAKQQFVNEDVYFDFDSSALLPEAQNVLKRKAEWLRANPGASVIVEGHCDERGTNEYNLALGDRRAESAKSFLADLGITGYRLTTVSYGEERPVDSASGEEAWAKNRRAHFVIK